MFDPYSPGHVFRTSKLMQGLDTASHNISRVSGNMGQYRIIECAELKPISTLL